MKTPTLNLKALELIGELQTEFDRETYLDIQKCIDDIKMKEMWETGVLETRTQIQENWA